MKQVSAGSTTSSNNKMWPRPTTHTSPGGLRPQWGCLTHMGVGRGRGWNFSTVGSPPRYGKSFRCPCSHTLSNMQIKCTRETRRWLERRQLQLTPNEVLNNAASRELMDDVRQRHFVKGPGLDAVNSTTRLKLQLTPHVYHEDYYKSLAFISVIVCREAEKSLTEKLLFTSSATFVGTSSVAVTFTTGRHRKWRQIRRHVPARPLADGSKSSVSEAGPLTVTGVARSAAGASTASEFFALPGFPAVSCWANSQSRSLTSPAIFSSSRSWVMLEKRTGKVEAEKKTPDEWPGGVLPSRDNLAPTKVVADECDNKLY